MNLFHKKEDTRSVAEKKAARKKIRIAVVAVILVIALVIALPKIIKKGSTNQEIMTGFAYRGSITSIVRGSGITKTKNSETLTLATSGTVEEVFVTEGQEVMAGEPLFNINSAGAKSMLESAKQNYEGYIKRLSALKKDLAGLNLTPKYSGKITNVVKLNAGDEVYKGQVLATLIDDRTMTITQYFSYAYEDAFYVGQKVDVSVPSLMSVLEGRVEAVNKVSRISKEGSKLFSVTVSVANPGVLAQGMVASMSTNVNGEDVFPYESGSLEYNRVGELKSTVAGTVISSKLMDYLEVEAGEVLVKIDAESSDNEIFEVEKQIEEAKKSYDRAQKNLDNCNAVAPISGKVIGLSVVAGSDIMENSVLCTISDTSQIVVNGTVDERNISYIKAGMSVQLNQWGSMTFGTVETVSWSSTINNGVATYPVTIVADNFGGMIQPNSYIDYEITASQSDDCLMVPLQSVRSVMLEDGSEANIVYVRNADPSMVVTLAYADEVAPEGFDPVQVEIGISDTANVEIKSGINEGDEVFLQYISDGYWG